MAIQMNLQYWYSFPVESLGSHTANTLIPKSRQTATVGWVLIPARSQVQTAWAGIEDGSYLEGLKLYQGLFKLNRASHNPSKLGRASLTILVISIPMWVDRSSSIQ